MDNVTLAVKKITVSGNPDDTETIVAAIAMAMRECTVVTIENDEGTSRIIDPFALMDFLNTSSEISQAPIMEPEVQAAVDKAMEEEPEELPEEPSDEVTEEADEPPKLEAVETTQKEIFPASNPEIEPEPEVRMTITEAARALGLKRKNLCKYLASIGYLKAEKTEDNRDQYSEGFVKGLLHKEADKRHAALLVSRAGYIKLKRLRNENKLPADTINKKSVGYYRWQEELRAAKEQLTA